MNKRDKRYKSQGYEQWPEHEQTKSDLSIGDKSGLSKGNKNGLKSGDKRGLEQA